MAIRKVIEAHPDRPDAKGYCATYREASTGQRKHKHFTRLRDAQEAVDLAKRNRQRLRAGLRVEAGPLTLGQYIDRYLSGWEGRGDSEAALRTRLGRLRKDWGNVLLGDLRSDALRAWLKSLPVSSRYKRDIGAAMLRGWLKCSATARMSRRQ